MGQPALAREGRDARFTERRVAVEVCRIGNGGADSLRVSGELTATSGLKCLRKLRVMTGPFHVIRLGRCPIVEACPCG